MTHRYVGLTMHISANSQGSEGRVVWRQEWSSSRLPRRRRAGNVEVAEVSLFCVWHHRHTTVSLQTLHCSHRLFARHRELSEGIGDIQEIPEMTRKMAMCSYLRHLCAFSFLHYHKMWISILNVGIVLVEGTSLPKCPSSIYCLDESLLGVVTGLNCQNITHWLWQCVTANSYSSKLFSIISRKFKPKGLMKQKTNGFQLLTPPVLLPNYHSFILL